MFDVHKFLLSIKPAASQAGGPPKAEHLKPYKAESRIRRLPKPANPTLAIILVNLDNLVHFRHSSILLYQTVTIRNGIRNNMV